MLELVIIAVIGAIILGSALLAIYHKSIVWAVVASGAVSLGASIIYLLMAAPDVAMTEAAIGSGLTTIIFLYALARMRKGVDHG